MRSPLPTLIVLGILLLPPALAATLEVGQGKPHATLASALGAAGAGDTILVSPGMYANSYASVSKSVTIRGVLDAQGNRPKFPSSGNIGNGKGILVVSASGVVIENLELSGAKVADRNGAGIRMDSGSMTVRNVYFHDNENGVLVGEGGAGDVVIENSIFEHNGLGEFGRTHNMYIGHAQSFTLRGSLSKGAVEGHLVKSRAKKNYILYNKIIDDAGSTASYKIDLPNGGLSYVIGNYIRRGPNAHNSALITFGVEGISNPGPQNLYVISNTMVDDGGGTFVRNSGGTLIAKNNIFAGGSPLSGTGNVAGSASDFVNPSAFDYRLKDTSALKDRGVDPGTGDGQSLAPTLQFIDPATTQARTMVGAAWDPGAYEIGSAAAACADSDRDGWGRPPANCANAQEDCNDNNPAIKPGIPEVCGNSVDDNCNSQTDEGCPPASGCVDADKDGYGTSASATHCAVTTPDCDDTNAGRRPNATEVCGNGIDENCDPADDSCVETCATDRDGDGYKAEAACGAARDCADLNADINPGRPERCGNGLDDDCDTRTDEDCPACTPTACDGDCDGVVGLHCGGPDCHDGNAAIRPNATENCANQLDDNCDQAIDAADAACGGNACAADEDRDGHKAGAACPALARDCDDRNERVHPGAAEVCGNGVDEDCQGGDAVCTATCPGNVPVGSCDAAGRLCLSDRTLIFNCFICPCPAGQLCVENACADPNACQPSYTCGPWTPAQCPASGRQGRTCTATNCPGAPAAKTETQSCTPAPLCSNGRLDPGEDCDGATEATCTDLDPALKGVLSCRPDCRFNAAGCCTTAPPPSGRRGPSYPPCPGELVSQETPGQTGTGQASPPTGQTAPNIQAATGTQSATLLLPSDWYLEPLNIALAAVIVVIGLLLLREIRSWRGR